LDQSDDSHEIIRALHLSPSLEHSFSHHTNCIQIQVKSFISASRHSKVCWKCSYRHTESWHFRRPWPALPRLFDLCPAFPTFRSSWAGVLALHKTSLPVNRGAQSSISICWSLWLKTKSVLMCTPKP